jgi:hypothetical protein
MLIQNWLLVERAECAKTAALLMNICKLVPEKEFQQ